MSGVSGADAPGGADASDGRPRLLEPCLIQEPAPQPQPKVEAIEQEEAFGTAYARLNREAQAEKRAKKTPGKVSVELTREEVFIIEGWLPDLASTSKITALRAKLRSALGEGE